MAGETSMIQSKSKFETDLKTWPILSLVPPTLLNRVRLCMVFGISNSEALMVMEDDDVYGIGTNSCGCLGIETEMIATTPVKIENLCQKKVINFGWTEGPHVFALTKNGELYHWGYHKWNSRSTVITVPRLIEKGVGGITNFGCHERSCAVIKDNGEINMFKEYLDYVSHIHQTIIQVGTCARSFILLTKKQILYGYGDNELGQLGLGHHSSVSSEVKRIEALDGAKIVKIACGFDHVLALSSTGLLYSWGGNSAGQLGNSDCNCNSNPTNVVIPERIIDIAAACTRSTSVALTEKRRAYVWGRCFEQNITVPWLTELQSTHLAFAHVTNGCMYEPIVAKRKVAKKSIVDMLQAIFDDLVTSDFTIIVEQKPIYVHKFILKLRSEYFRAMFQEHWTENNQRSIEYHDHSYGTYRAFLKYLYTNTLELPIDDLAGLMELANIHNIPEMRQDCIDMVDAVVGVENVLPMYVKAVQMDDKEFEDAYLRIILRDTKATVKSPSFQQLDEATLKRLVIAIADRDGFET